MSRLHLIFPIVCSLLLPSFLGKAAEAQGTTAKPPHKNETKGQGQLAGGNGQFGVIYTLQDKLNFEILSAKYTLEPINAYEHCYATADEKILLLDIAIKNADTSDKFFNGDSLFTLVDSAGQLITGGSWTLKSKGSKENSFNLRPGQGLGQPDLKDPLQIGFKVPNKSRIVKIMVNKGRLGKTEEVFRYYVAGATKAEAGEAGDPKNLIAALPENSRDPKDPSGATPLPAGKGVAGVFYPTGPYGIRFDSMTYVTEKLKETEPDEGKKFAVVTVTARDITDKEQGFFELAGSNDPVYEITDAEGESYKPLFMLKAKTEEEADHQFKPGGPDYTFRIVFSVPKGINPKVLYLGAGASPKWAYDVSAIK